MFSDGVVPCVGWAPACNDDSVRADFGKCNGLTRVARGSYGRWKKARHSTAGQYRNRWPYQSSELKDGCHQIRNTRQFRQLCRS